MRARIRLMTGIVLLLAAPSLRAAQEAECTRLQAFATVEMRRTGAPVGGLAAENFRVSVGRQQARVTGATFRTESPGRVMVVLDTSGSMVSKAGQLELTLELAKYALAALPPETEAGLVLFSREQQRVLPPGTERSQLVAVLDAVDEPEFGKGRTALRDAMAKALALLAPARLGDVVYAITDGADNHSRVRQSQLERAFAAAGVRLFATLMIHRFPRAGEERDGPIDTEHLAQQTGGGSFRLELMQDLFRRTGPTTLAISDHRKEEVVAGLADLYMKMGTLYVLELETEQPLGRNERWRVEVVDASGKRRRDLVAHHPRHLPACIAVR
jgi:Mg-chelatase subunit ChlD